MCRNWDAVNHIFHMVARLIYTQKGETVKDTGVNLFTTIGNDTNHYLNVTMRETGPVMRVC